jgi:hypothetical protein
MGAQILRISHLHSKFDQPKITPRPAVRKADKGICPVCGGSREFSSTNMLKRTVVVLVMMFTLLAALAIFTGIFIAALEYAANQTNQTFYEMSFSHTPFSQR